MNPPSNDDGRQLTHLAQPIKEELIEEESQTHVIPTPPQHSTNNEQVIPDTPSIVIIDPSPHPLPSTDNSSNSGVFDHLNTTDNNNTTDTNTTIKNDNDNNTNPTTNNDSRDDFPKDNEQIVALQKFIHQSSYSLDSNSQHYHNFNIQLIRAGNGSLAHVSADNSPASTMDNLSLMSHDLSEEDQHLPPQMVPTNSSTCNGSELVALDVSDVEQQEEQASSVDVKELERMKKRTICVWILVACCCFVYLCVVGGLGYFSGFAIDKSVHAFTYFNLSFSSKNECNFESGLKYKHYSLNNTIFKTCSIQKVLEIDVNKDSFENSDKLTFFYLSTTPMDIYYFKELSSFRTYNSTGYLDPTSVNYWLKTQGQYGFKQIGLSIIDNSTDVQVNSNYGVRVVVTLKMLTTESTNSSTLLNSLTTLSESSMDDYQDYNSTSFPLTFQGSYYIESYMCEITLYMTGVALSWLFILLTTLVLLTRVKRAKEAKELGAFLPFSIRKLFGISQEPSKKKEKTNDHKSDRKVGVKLEYERLTFQDFSGSTHLHETSGEFLPYTLTALLGESGSGKVGYCLLISNFTILNI